LQCSNWTIAFNLGAEPFLHNWLVLAAPEKKETNMGIILPARPEHQKKINPATKQSFTPTSNDVEFKHSSPISAVQVDITNTKTATRNHFRMLLCDVDSARWFLTRNLLAKAPAQMGLCFGATRLCR